MTQRRQHGTGATGISRRDALRLGATAAAGVAVGPFVLRVAGAGDAFSWQRFKGSKIFIQVNKNPWSETMQKMLPDFEKQTGIKVEFAELPELQARQKLTVEFTAGSGGIDVWATSMHVEKRRFWKSGWYFDVSKYLKDPTMTAPEYDWSDMTAGAKAIATQSDGSISGLPSFVDPWILFYRKDLFAQKRLKPPMTLAEMEEFAQKFHSAPKFYGFVARGLKNANAPAWDWVLFSMGGNFQTKDGKASLDHPRGGEGDGLLRRDAQALRPARRGQLQLVRMQQRLHAGPGGPVLRRRQLRQPVRGQGKVQDRRARWATPSCPPGRAATSPRSSATRWP